MAVAVSVERTTRGELSPLALRLARLEVLHTSTKTGAIEKGKG